MNHLDRTEFEPVLAVAKRGGGYEPFLAKDVPIHGVSLERLPSSAGRLLLSPVGLRRLLTRLEPDLVCSVMDYSNLLALGTVATLRKRPKVVALVQIPPTIELGKTRFGRDVVLPLIRKTYRRADRIIALSRGVKADLCSIDPGLAANITVIHNACVDDRLQAPDPEADAKVPSASRPVLVAAGRLTYQKGFPDLLEAMALLRKTHDAELWILGEGPDRTALEAQIAQLGLGSCVKLLGFQSAPQAFFKKATLFVLSSLYEGFGNVVVEALGCGTPVVSTDCPHGPSEIIQDGVNGLLTPVGDPNALAAAMKRVLDDPALRSRLSIAGLERSKAFHGSVIAGLYGAELRRVAGVG
jgi:glycosyltransferase involved in cell wall biosynthesis